MVVTRFGLYPGPQVQLKGPCSPIFQRATVPSFQDFNNHTRQFRLWNMDHLIKYH